MQIMIIYADGVQNLCVAASMREIKTKKYTSYEIYGTNDALVWPQ